MALAAPARWRGPWRWTSPLAGSRPFVNHPRAPACYVDMVNARRQLERVPWAGRLAEGRRASSACLRQQPAARTGPSTGETPAGYGCIFAGKLQVRGRRAWRPAYRPDLADGWAGTSAGRRGPAVLARSRLVAAVLTGTLGRSPGVSLVASPDRSTSRAAEAASASGCPPTAKVAHRRIRVSSTASTRRRLVVYRK